MKRICTILLFLTLIVHLESSAQYDAVSDTHEETIATFSIVARDSVTGELGVAVASKFFTVGNVVPWAKTGVGAVATQAYANTSFGWRGLELLEQGLTPEEIRDVFVRTDDGHARRQFGIVAADGQSVTYTGDSCSAWAGGRAGKNYAVQGNILTGERSPTDCMRHFWRGNPKAAIRAANSRRPFWWLKKARVTAATPTGQLIFVSMIIPNHSKSWAVFLKSVR